MAWIARDGEFAVRLLAGGFVDARSRRFGGCGGEEAGRRVTMGAPKFTVPVCLAGMRVPGVLPDAGAGVS